MIGINDFRLGDTTENVFKNYKSIIEDIRDHNIEVIVQSTLFISEKAIEYEYLGIKDDDIEIINYKVRRLNKKLEEYCFERKTAYLNINKEVSKNEMLENQNTDDGLHINQNGYRNWARIIKEYLYR